MMQYTIKIKHWGIDPNTNEYTEVINTERVRADSPDEAVVISLMRTLVDRSSMGTTLMSIEVLS